MTYKTLLYLMVNKHSQKNLEFKHCLFFLCGACILFPCLSGFCTTLSDWLGILNHLWALRYFFVSIWFCDRMASHFTHPTPPVLSFYLPQKTQLFIPKGHKGLKGSIKHTLKQFQPDRMILIESHSKAPAMGVGGTWNISHKKQIVLVSHIVLLYDWTLGVR